VGSTDVFVVTFDSVGKLRWTKQAGGNFFDSGFGVSLDSAGNCYLVGRVSGTALFDSLSLTPRSKYDPFLARINGDPPSLKVFHSEGQFVLYWPSNKFEFVLETSTNLATGANWLAVTNPSTIIGAQRLVIIGTSLGNRFFRLRE